VAFDWRLRQDEQPEGAMQIVVTDASSAGREIARLLLSDVPDRIRVRDLIRYRVREEVARFNAAPAGCFTGLVQPVGSEQTLAGYRLSQPRRLDWQAQANAAVAAFRRNGFSSSSVTGRSMTWTRNSRSPRLMW